ncbi:MAG: hypothetical protein BGO68_00470 [Candidatus Amoebophilus sp. 36-38]|nr:MAG: hypothetical protein BGO68_00470 [Candidatus Amoebophilus sp. 36-38]
MSACDNRLTMDNPSVPNDDSLLDDPLLIDSLPNIGTKRKEPEKPSVQKEEKSTAKSSKRLKLAGENRLPLTNGQPGLFAPPLMMGKTASRRAKLALAQASTNNTRKEPEQAFTRKEENGMAEGSKHLKNKMRVYSRLPREERKNKRKKLEAPPILAHEMLSSLAKSRIAEISTQQPNLANMDAPYRDMEVQELAELANSNDTKAQEEIVSRCLKGSLTPLLASLIDPYSWAGREKKACQDQRYVYLWLHVSKPTNEPDLYAELLEHIKANAASGDPLAQTNLGYMYAKGIGIQVDCREAINWYKKAAIQGYAVAQNELGYMYDNGLLGKDYDYRERDRGVYDKEAIKWYTQAVNQGYAPALTNLGNKYQTGIGIKGIYPLPIKAKAIELYRKAAEQGNVQAKYYLGETYYHGKTIGMHYKGVDADHEEAFKWFSEAANQGHAEAQAKLGLMYNNGKILKQDFVTAAKWYIKAAEGGSEAAQEHMGIIYQQGRGVPKDIAQAVYWSMQAKNRSRLGSIFKRQQSPLPLKRQQTLLLSTDQVSHQEMGKIESNLLDNWQALQEEPSRADELTESYQQLKEILDRFKQWRLALHTQSELLVSCLQFDKQEYRLAIETRQQETGIIPYVKQHTLHNNEYLSFGESNVEIAEAIVKELTEKTLYNQVQEMLKQVEEKYKAAMWMQKVEDIQGEAKQFKKYYTLFLEEIEKGQYTRNQKFKEKHSYLFTSY